MEVVKLAFFSKLCLYIKPVFGYAWVHKPNTWVTRALRMNVIERHFRVGVLKTFQDSFTLGTIRMNGVFTVTKLILILQYDFDFGYMQYKTFTSIVQCSTYAVIISFNPNFMKLIQC